MKKKLTIVVPVLNEDSLIENFYNSMLNPVLKKLEYDYEVIFIDDGSSDSSLKILQGFASKNKRVKVIAFSRNFGKEVALTAGIREANGDAIIMIDSDGQQPPKLIPTFLKKWEDGADIVIGVRGKYEKHGFIAKLGSKLFYKMMHAFGSKDLVRGSTDFCLIDRNVADEFNQLSEHNRITRGLVAWVGFKKEFIEYKYGTRMAGRPSYNFRKLAKLAFDSFTSMSTGPLAMIGWFGGAITLLSGMLGLFVLVEQFVMKDPIGLNWTGTTCVAIFITFLVGIVLISQSITALYIAQIHAEAQGRPLYIINKKESKNLKAK